MYKTTEKILSIVSTLLKIFVVLIFVFPFLWMISISLQTSAEISTFPATLLPSSPQFVNYVTAWLKAPFLTYLKNSILIVGSIIVANVIIMIPAAYAFAKYEFRGKKLLFGLVLIAFMTPLQVTFIPHLLHHVGLGPAAHPLAPDPSFPGRCLWHFPAAAVLHAGAG